MIKDVHFLLHLTYIPLSSAGGTLTNVISHLYRDAAILPPLTGVFLSIISCVGASVTLPEEYASLQEQSSWEQNKDAPIIGSGGILFFECKRELKSLSLKSSTNELHSDI